MQIETPVKNAILNIKKSNPYKIGPVPWGMCKISICGILIFIYNRGKTAPTPYTNG